MPANKKPNAVIPLRIGKRKRRIEHLLEVRGELGQEGTVISGNRDYLVGKVLHSSSLADFYSCSCEHDELLLKVVRDQENNEMLVNEAATLTKLYNEITETGKSYLPKIVDKFNLPIGDGGAQAIVLSAVRGYNAIEIREAYPSGVEPVHLAWMINRLFEAIGLISDVDFVNGAILPSNIEFIPATHGMRLTEWAYAVPSATHTYISAIDESFESYYPPEVFKKKPAIPRIDIFMAARCAMYIGGGNPVTGVMPSNVPKPIAGLLRHCALVDSKVRPYDAFDVCREFGAIFKQQFGPKKFVDFNMPARA